MEEIAETDGYSLGRPFAVQPLSDGDTVLFLRTSADDDSSDLWSLRLSTGEEARLLSANELLGGSTESVSAEERARRERQRIRTSGFTSFSLSRDEQRIVLKLSGDLYLFDRPAGIWGRIDLPRGVLLAPRLRPDGQALAFVLDHNLHMAELAPWTESGAVIATKVVPLTNDGTKDRPRGVAEFVAQEEMGRMEGYWWSPDGTWIAFQLSDATAVERMTLADPAHPERAAHVFTYPRPGKNNVDVRLAVIEARAGAQPTEIAWDRDRYPYLARVIWRDRTRVSLLVQSRDQERQTFYSAGTDGTLQELWTETDDTWLNLASGAPRWIAEGQSLLWADEAKGAWRLLRRPASGGHPTVLVAPTAGLQSVVHVDEQRGFVWFVGGPNPTEQHIFRVQLDGTGAPERITDGAGYHVASLARDGGIIAIERSSLTHLPETTVHSVSGKGTLGPAVAISAHAKAPPFMPHVELVPAADKSGFNSLVVWPHDREPGQAYPVIVYVYGGPHVNLVQTIAQRFFIPQYIADHGFAVVSIDGRGTPRRGRDFERAIDLDLAGVTLDDQVAGLEALAERFPELDASRVGIYGWSFGGYMSALALMKRPDVFLAGVSGAPVSEWRYYDTHYTERYLGVPTEDDAPYDRASLLTYASQLDRPLMLVHGVADDNVYFAHSLQLAEALFRAGKSFEFIPLVGLTHQLSDPAVRKNLFDRVTSFFMARLGAPCRIASR